uniref:Uncharacterized protein n=1 Tax=Proboscia inermis TaxID=420281 RepID=A0A7S0CES6_9STRA|mmetsp:Transcript_42603/g.43168  ORF Transcript_42603/g.43168 Transcript_42603/m.43168 type:complete len:144 (+) Transcript_42603:47-478(+)
MPPNSCHDLALLFNQIDVENQALNPGSIFTHKQQQQFRDCPNYDVSDSKENEARRQAAEEMEHYWDYSDDHYHGMTAAKREEAEAKRTISISMGQIRVAQKIEDCKQSESFKAGNIEASLLKDSKRRTDEYLNPDPSGGYWDL